MIKATDGRAAVLRPLEQSGLTMAEFCRRRGLRYGTMALWRSQGRRAGGKFVEVEMPHGAGQPREASAMLCAELAEINP